MTENENKPPHQRIQVVNKYKHEPTTDDVYIGRGSVFGNPYSHINESDFKVKLVVTREEAIDKYKEYFEEVINSCGCANKDFKNKIRSMVVTVKTGGNINLVCFCKPKACHGDVIRDYILTQI